MPIEIGGGSGGFSWDDDPFEGFGEIKRLRQANYDPDWTWRQTTNRRTGSIYGGPSMEHLYNLTYQPELYTVLAPPKRLNERIFATATDSQSPRLGAFTLDMIDWNRAPAQLTGLSFGDPNPWAGPSAAALFDPERGAGFDPFLWLEERDIDLLSFEAASRIMDYAFAPVAAFLPENTPGKDHAGRFPFQKDPRYYAWLRDSSPANRQKMAEFFADTYAERGKNGWLRDELQKQYEKDFLALEMKSTGNPRLDYLVLKNFERVWEDTNLLPQVTTTGKTGLDLYAAYGQHVVNTTATLINSTAQFGRMALTNLGIPGVGGVTEVLQAADPVRPEVMRIWNDLLTPQQRGQIIEAAVGPAGLLLMGVDLASALWAARGVNTIVSMAETGTLLNLSRQITTGLNLPQAMSIGKSATTAYTLARTYQKVEPAVQTFVSGYHAAIRGTQVLMGVGLTNMLANWTLEATIPGYEETIGRKIDNSRIISNSPFAGAFNLAGNFASFYGVEYAVPRLIRNARETANAVRYPLKPTAWGKLSTPDLAFNTAHGGSPLGNVFDEALGITHHEQQLVLGSQLISHYANQVRMELGAVIQAVKAGKMTGVAALDMITDPVARTVAAEARLFEHVKTMTSDDMLNLWTQAFQARIGKGSKNPVVRRRLLAWAKKMDNTATLRANQFYGSLRWSSDVGELRSNAEKLLRGLMATGGLKSADLDALAKWAGNSSERWVQVNRRLHAVLFQRRAGALATAAEGTDEAGKLSLFSMRTLFGDEVPDMVAKLLDPDPAVGRAEMERLIRDKDDVQAWDAQRTNGRRMFTTPEDLARILATTEPVLPRRRLLAENHAAGALNDFTKMLDDEGIWAIGYKPTKHIETPEGWKIPTLIIGPLPKPPQATYEVVALTPADMLAQGYRMYQPYEFMWGRDFAARDPHWLHPDAGGGVWIKDDGTAPRYMAGRDPNGAPAPAPSAATLPGGAPSMVAATRLADDEATMFSWLLQGVINDSVNATQAKAAAYGWSKVAGRDTRIAELHDLDGDYFNNPDGLMEAVESWLSDVGNPDTHFIFTDEIWDDITDTGTYDATTTFFGIDLTGYGDTRPEAVADLYAKLESLVNALDTKVNDHIGPAPQTILDQRVQTISESYIFDLGVTQPEVLAAAELARVRGRETDLDHLITMVSAQHDAYLAGSATVFDFEVELFDFLLNVNGFNPRWTFHLSHDPDLGEWEITGSLYGLPIRFAENSRGDALESLWGEVIGLTRQLRELGERYHADGTPAVMDPGIPTTSSWTTRAPVAPAGFDPPFWAPPGATTPDLVTLADPDWAEVPRWVVPMEGDVLQPVTDSHEAFTSGMYAIPKTKASGEGGMSHDGPDGKWTGEAGGMYVSGGNGGANWPILYAPTTGRLYVFKGQYQGYNNPIGDMNQAVQMAAPTAAKLGNFLGLHVAQEIPYTHVINGVPVQGTLQPYFDDALGRLPLRDSAQGADDMLAFEADHPGTIAQLEEAMVYDWFTSQHDSNEGAFLLMRDSHGREVVGIVDRGQSWKAFGNTTKWGDESGGMLDDWWGWDGSGGTMGYLIGGDALPDYLMRIAQREPAALDRSHVERILLRIEAIPDDVLRESLRPLAEARHAAYGLPVEEFLDQMVARKYKMREAVNNAYDQIDQIRIERPGQLQTFGAGKRGEYLFDGNPVPVNAAIGPMVEGTFMEPPGPATPAGGFSSLRAGVVMVEEDGSIWLVEPKGHFSGNIGMLPRGGVEPGESMRQAALREMFEETGFTVELTGFLHDLVEPNGTWTRFYTARRTGGGPRHMDPATSESASVRVGTEAQVREKFIKVVNGQRTVDWRWNEVLDALHQEARSGNPTVRPPRDPAMGTPEAEVIGDLDELVPADQPPVPGGDTVTEATARTDPDFVSYVTLPDGTIYTSPWLDFPLHREAHIDIGSRGFAMSKFDNVFMGFRSWRLTEMQKGALWRRLDVISPAFTPANVAAFHANLLKLARNERLPIQALATNNIEAIPYFIEARRRVNAMAEEVFGKGPYLNRRGEMVEVDWAREISYAYRTALTLNATAGVTSRLYAGMGAAGHAASWMARIVYPAFRFHFSPFFKAGEFAESWMLNGMRGVNPFGGDPLADALLIRGGLGLGGHDLIQSEYGMDQLVESLGQQRSDMAEHGRAVRSFFWADRPAVGLAQQRLNPTPTQMPGPKPTSRVDELLFGAAREGDEVHPFTLPESSADFPDIFRPIVGADADGTPIYGLDNRGQDQALLEARREMWLRDVLRAVTEADDPQLALIGFARSLALIDHSLGADFIPRLAAAMTPVHAAAGPRGSVADLLDAIEQNIIDGFPELGGATAVSGPPAALPSRRVFGTPTLTGEGSAAVSGPTELGPDANTAVSMGEEAGGHVVSTFASGGPVNSWGSHTASIHFIMKPETWSDAILTDGDRISSIQPQNPATTRRHIISAAGALQALQLSILRGLVGMLSEGKLRQGDDIVEALVGSADAQRLSGLSGYDHPVEVAWARPQSLERVDAIIIPTAYRGRWDNIVATHGDAHPHLRAIKVIERQGASGTEATQFFLERAGLADRGKMNFATLADEDVLTYLPDDLVPRFGARDSWDVVDYVLAQRGLSGVVKTSFRDYLLDVEQQAQYRAWQSSAQVAGYSAEPRLAGSPQLAPLYSINAAAESAQKATSARMLINRLDELAERMPADTMDEVLRLAQEADDVEVKALARGWLDELQDIKDAAVTEGVWGTAASQSIDIRTPFRSPVSIVDKVSDEVIWRGEDLPPLERDPYSADLEKSRPDYADATKQVIRWLGDKSNPRRDWVGHRQSTSSWGGTLEAHNELGWGRVDLPRVQKSVMPMHFFDLLRRRATEKLGYDPGAPIARAYVVGKREGQLELRKPAWSNGWNEAEYAAMRDDHGTVVITVTGPDGMPYAELLPGEIGEIWIESQRLEMHDISMVPDGARDSTVLWMERPGTAYGELHVKPYGTTGNGQFFMSIGTDLRHYNDNDPWFIPFKVDFQPAYRPAADDVFMDLTGDRIYLPAEVHRSPLNISGSTYRLSNAGDTWHVDVKEGTHGTRLAEINLVAYNRAYLGPGEADQLLDAVLANTDPTEAVILTGNIPALDAIAGAYAARSLRGEIPANWSMATLDGEVFSISPYLRVLRGRTEAAAREAVLDQAPTVGIAVQEKMREVMTGRAKAKADVKEAVARFWNPVAYKTAQQQKLAMKIFRDELPDVLAEVAPYAYRLLTKDLAIPENKIAEFLITDRMLLENWLKTGSATDFEKLLAHADRYITPQMTRLPAAQQPFVAPVVSKHFYDRLGVHPPRLNELPSILDAWFRRLDEAEAAGREPPHPNTVNSWARKYADEPDFPDDPRGLTREGVEHGAAWLEDKMNGYVAQSDGYVWRAARTIPGAEPGMVYYDPAFPYAGADMDMALHYYKPDPDHALFRIKIDKGSSDAMPNGPDFMLRRGHFRVVTVRQMKHGDQTVTVIDLVRSNADEMTAWQMAREAQATAGPLARLGPTGQDQLDDLYQHREWPVMLEAMRLTMETALEESFGVHFFNIERSAFERSINHPLLGVYPASWAYKVAREWARFLFFNQTFKNFRLGMTPAVFISESAHRQGVMWAQSEDESLEDFYRQGPLASSIFLFNLLMPGDWSSLPFPLSRSLRDLLRGNLDPYQHFVNNATRMGLGRDIRLGVEMAQEWGGLAGQALGVNPPMEKGEVIEEPKEYARK